MHPQNCRVACDDESCVCTPRRSAYQPGFEFWDRDTLNKFAWDVSAAIRSVLEIVDNNNPASIMYDDPRKALEQIELMLLGVSKHPN